MKPRLIVHIGTPKTGTTTIQLAMFDARRRLRVECDVHLASTERERHRHRHLSVAKAALGSAEDIEAEYRALMKDFERSGCSAMMISEENLSAQQSRLARFFARFTKDFDLNVICYLRRQDYFVESAYNQVMRMRRFVGIPPISAFWRDDDMIPKLDYHRILGNWLEVTDKVHVRDFSKEVKNVGLLPSFFDAAGMSRLGDMKARDANISYDLRLLILLCMLSPGVPKGEAVPLNTGLMRAARTLMDTGVAPSQKHALGRIERTMLLEECARSNELLKKDFGIDFGHQMPDEPDAELTAPDAQYLLTLVGELTSFELMHFYRAAQASMSKLLGASSQQAPKQLVDQPSPDDFDIDGEPIEVLFGKNRTVKSR